MSPGKVLSHVPLFLVVMDEFSGIFKRHGKCCFVRTRRIIGTYEKTHFNQALKSGNIDHIAVAYVKEIDEKDHCEEDVHHVFFSCDFAQVILRRICRSANGHTGSFVNAVNRVSAPVNSNSVISSSPTLVLEDSCLVEWDFSKCAIGKVKDVHSLSNILIFLNDEGFTDITPKYLGGLWVLLEFGKQESKKNFMDHSAVNSWFHLIQDVHLDFVSDECIAWVDIEGVPLQAWSRETFLKIGNKWGDLMSIEDTSVASFGRKRVCILTNYPTSILKSFKIIVKGKVYVVRAKELFTWSPNFLGIKENLCSSDDESISGRMHNSNHSFVSEEEEGEFNPSDGDVPETIFGDNSASKKGHSRNSKKQMSEDPFGIYKILKKNHPVGDSQPSPSLSHPPGFSLVIIGSHSSSDHAKVADKDPQINFQEASSDAQFKADSPLIQEASSDAQFKADSPLIDVEVLNSPHVVRMKEFSTSRRKNVDDNGGSVLGVLEELGHKRVLWDYLSLLIDHWNGEVILMGDFNEVRSKEERHGSVFNHVGARVFNQFISSSGLIDVKMEGYYFTWSHPSATQMSKVDRFLVSDGIFSLFPSILASCLDRHLLDHRPILLRDAHLDFGPIPFWNAMIHFKKKLQDLTIIIRQWIKEMRAQNLLVKHSALGELSDIDKELDKGNVFDALLAKRCAFIGQIYDIKKKEAVNSFQKSKVRLSILQANHLERNVSHDEIRAVVWNYGDNKSPGPDGGCNSSFIALIPKVVEAKYVNDFWPISLIGCVYKVVMKILATRLALVLSSLIFDTQVAFISERHILDGPFIISEVLNWCKRKHKKAMFFKVDFAMAYDSVRWDYLIDVLEAFGFGSRWCQWIRGTFSFAKTSVLVNGSPSDEFIFHYGLKQGDPLVPLLFIIVMESLHLSFSKVVEADLFTGIRLTTSLSLSHLFYADDALIIREWSNKNLRAPKGVLKEMESIRNNFFIGAGNLDRKITWITWDTVLASKKKGGLGVSSFFALNWALILKWVDGSFRRPARGGHEQDQLNILNSFIESVSLSLRPMTGRIGLHLITRTLGFRISSSRQESKISWKVSLELPGGLYGGFEINFCSEISSRRGGDGRGGDGRRVVMAKVVSVEVVMGDWLVFSFYGGRLLVVMAAMCFDRRWVRVTVFICVGCVCLLEEDKKV
nr:RNA-directed DNA polymerase, eukaryota [Tanacetum cinerariifolium]